MELNTNWQFRKAASGDGDWMQAVVPGTVHTDLYVNGIIGDPFYRTNEREQQWIDKEDWEYRTFFTVTEEICSRDRVELIFRGLDTYAGVFLNGTLLAETDNMFREWVLDCKSLLKTGENELRIVFRSAIKIGLEKLAALGYPLPAANDLSELGGLGGQQVSVFSRKPGYHYGWDWGPRFVTSGIWKPISLSAWNTAEIRHVHYKLQELTEELAAYRAEIEIEAAENCAALVKITSSSDLAVKAEENFNLQRGINSIILNFEIPNPRLWWCNGLGEAVLYSMTTQLIEDDRLVDYNDTKIGIRSVRVIQKADSKGKSFYVELNGIPVFMKGANYIPNDIFLPRVTAEDYGKIVKAARYAHMNMLRVWGGGIYEQDLFYELCDENGILVWQDFMFACALYPGDKAFLENVRTEAEQNVIRLRNHPCIALWCGNNEIHYAWASIVDNTDWGWKKIYTLQQQDELWQTYDKLFHHILPDVIEKNTHKAFYWPSSPMAADGKPATFNTASGDIHYWGVWHDRQPFSEYNNHIGRFVSEYGFQSFPGLKTIKTFTVPEDWDINSEVMQSHQRSGTGNTLIKKYMTDHYKIPGDFESFLYISQLLQAEAVMSAIEAHRRNMPYCMGSLFWQLNDCWPVVSWSSIDYCKQWKALHYYACAAYKQVVIIPCIHDQQLELFIASDRIMEFNGTLKLQLYDFRGNVLVESSQNVSVKAGSCASVFSGAIKIVLDHRNPGEAFLSAILIEDTAPIIRRLIYFKHLKDIDFPYAQIQTQIEKSAEGCQIRLTSDVLAKNVFLETDETDDFFSDNFFDIIPGETMEVKYIPGKTATDLEKTLKITVLNNIYFK